MSNLRAATYARFSTDKQTESSTVDQRRACAEYAARHGLEIVLELADEGISGASTGNRPAVQELERAVLTRRVDVVLVADLSRLSRSQADLMRLVERFRFRGVRVVGVLDGFDSDHRHARMQAGLSGLMSDELRAGIRDRVHLALESRAKRAEPTGSRAYGYTGKREPIEAEAAVVRELFKRAAAGEPLRAIVADFNARGIPSPGATWKRAERVSDGLWRVSAAHSILGNEVYRGRLVWNRSQWVKNPDTGRRERRERPPADWIVHERPELALVDAATFDTVAKRRPARAGFKPGAGGGPRYLLSGLLECGECGAKMIIAGGGTGARYYCGTYKSAGVAGCSNTLGVLRSVAEARILEPLEARLLSPEAVERAVAAMRREHAKPAGPPPDFARLDAQIGRVRAMVAAGDLDPALAAPILERAEAERMALRRAAAAPVLAHPAPFERAYRATVAALREKIRGPHIAAAREALHGLVGPVRLERHAEGYFIAQFQRLAPLALAVGSQKSSGGRI